MNAYRIKNVIYVDGRSVEPADCPICGGRPEYETHARRGGFYLHRYSCCRLDTQPRPVIDLNDEVELIMDWNAMAEMESDNILTVVQSIHDVSEWVRLARLTRRYNPENRERIRSYLSRAHECRERSRAS